MDDGAEHLSRDLGDGSLVPHLDVEPDGADRFTTRLRSFDGRTFGGELLAKAVTAAGRTCPDRWLHSLHGYFLRAVRPDHPVRLEVARLRDGRRMAHRRVEVVQDDRPVCEWTASFTSQDSGPTFQEGGPESSAGPDTGLRSGGALAVEEGWRPTWIEPLDWRYVDHPWRREGDDEETRWRAWVRPRQPLPDDPILHAAAVAYASDYGSLGALERRFLEEFVWDRSTSLDHALWIHRPAHRDGGFGPWWLMTSRSDRAHDGRALTERRFDDRHGALVATAVQEALFDLRDGADA